MIRRTLNRLLTKVRPHRQVAYDDTFFKDSWFRNWAELQPVLAALLATQPRWRTILDYGCGPGIMIDPMNDAGYHYVGCDLSDGARSLYLERYGKYRDLFISDLPAPESQNFDLLLAFDVFEHLTDDEVRTLLRQTRAIPDLFVNISRQRGIPGHVNIKRDSRWIELCQSEGLRFVEDTTELLRGRYRELRPRCPDLWERNMFVFTRATRP